MYQSQKFLVLKKNIFCPQNTLVLGLMESIRIKIYLISRTDVHLFTNPNSLKQNKLNIFLTLWKIKFAELFMFVNKETFNIYTGG